jgi:hypothetical protein
MEAESISDRELERREARAKLVQEIWILECSLSLAAQRAYEAYRRVQIARATSLVDGKTTVPDALHGDDKAALARYEAFLLAFFVLRAAQGRLKAFDLEG